MNKFAINKDNAWVLAVSAVMIMASFFLIQNAFATADTTAPTVAITAPVASATVTGSVAVVATSTDDTGVVGVQFKLDGTNLGDEATVTPYSVTWNTTLTTNGTHSLTAVSRDAAGNTMQSAAVAVVVSNTTTPTPTPTPTPVPGATRQSLEIGPKGNVHMQNATVLSAGSGTLSVKTWGITFTVSVSADTKIRAHNGGVMNLSEVKVGDVLDVQGSINQDTGVVSARELRDDSIKKDDTQRQQTMKDLMAQIQELMKKLQALRGQGKGEHGGGDDH